MREYDLGMLIKNHGFLDEKIREFTEKKIIVKQRMDAGEIEGHVEKSGH